MIDHRDPIGPLLAVPSIDWIDVTAIAILALFLIMGLVRGLFWQLTRIGSLVLAYATAVIFGAPLAEVTRGWYSPDIAPQVPLYAAHLALFIAVLVVATLIGFLLNRMFEDNELTAFNRASGAVLGLGTGALIVLALLTGVQMLHAGTGLGESVAQAAASSSSQNFGHDALVLVGDRLPEDWRVVPQEWSVLLEPAPPEAR